MRPLQSFHQMDSESSFLLFLFFTLLKNKGFIFYVDDVAAAAAAGVRFFFSASASFSFSISATNFSTSSKDRVFSRKPSANSLCTKFHLPSICKFHPCTRYQCSWLQFEQPFCKIISFKITNFSRRRKYLKQ